MQFRARLAEGPNQPSYRVLLAITSALIVVASMGAVKRTVDQNAAETAAQRGPGGAGLADTHGALDGFDPITPGSDGSVSGPGGGTGRSAAVVGGGGGGGTQGVPQRLAPGLKYPPGVTDTEIKLVYYWKGDRTMTSPYLQGSGHEGNVDEGKAFHGLVNYLNKHPNGDRTFFGMPFNLHGRKLTGIVLEAGQASDSYGFTAQKIVKTHKPLVAIAAHGSLSTYICPILAKAGIHNLATYDLGGALAKSTGGYCWPNGLTWERQVEVTERYLLKQQQTQYTGPEAPAGPEERRYGVIYSEYPGLVDSAPQMIARFKKAGVNIVAERTLSASLTDAQRQSTSVVAEFRSKEVNTLLIPDAGAPLNFTHVSQGQGYQPDYYVWPCSGLDNEGMVRLYNAGQWSRASGLTCYDQQFNPDLTNDDDSRASEWWKWYEEGSGSSDVPAPTALVAAGLFQALIGITHAGPELTLERFRGGLDAFTPYRYNALTGRTTNPSNMLLVNNTPDRTFIGDVAKVRWDTTTRSSGNAASGQYVYPEKKRYTETAAF